MQALCEVKKRFLSPQSGTCNAEKIVKQDDSETESDDQDTSEKDGELLCEGSKDQSSVWL